MMLGNQTKEFCAMEWIAGALLLILVSVLGYFDEKRRNPKPRDFSSSKSKYDE